MSSIICVGGAHTAAVKCVNDYSYAHDDQSWMHLGDVPHPDNKTNAWQIHITPVMKIGSFNISKANYNNETIMTTTMRYVNTKPHPQDVIAIIGWENWDGLLRGHESLLKDVIQLHEQLNNTKTKHLMFNTVNCLNVQENNRYDFGDSYIGPYEPQETMVSQLTKQNLFFNPGTEYYGPDAHKAWARILLNRLTQIV
jgi:hypothetical protein